MLVEHNWRIIATFKNVCVLNPGSAAAFSIQVRTKSDRKNSLGGFSRRRKLKIQKKNITICLHALSCSSLWLSSSLSRNLKNYPGYKFRTDLLVPSWPLSILFRFQLHEKTNCSRYEQFKTSFLSYYSN